MSKIYENAKEIYASFGIDTDKVIEEVRKIPVSMHCWQGDDVKGFENPNGTLTGGIQTTGNYPGAATNIEQLRADFEKACSLIPGSKRINLHAIYLDAQGEKVERNEIQPKHFDSWIDWAKKLNLGIDFNPTCFSHPLSGDGFTLSHPNEEIRKFWIEHCIASRKIAAYIGEKLGNTVATNYWIPDGFKDIPVDRMGARERLIDSYDQIFAEYIDPKYNLDAMEGKVFGIGAESCTIGSNDFYLAYAIKYNKLITLDAGHFHPTEMISDKISTALLFAPGLLLHVSRPVRWDSDHVVIFDDELRAIAEEIIRSGMVDKVHIGLDFFDASINRIAAWVIGTRNMQKALLYAKLQPADKLKEFEITGDYTSRLAYLEAFKTLPFAAVWDRYCELENVPTGLAWLNEVKKYEADVLSKR
ncbi:MAG: L-rhamnose isomerase [Clostridia bacterium]|nr:L-rhamnose isomerase [Clostridia bacterium]